MLSVAGIRYRNVMAAHGGPVALVQTGETVVYGRTLHQANVHLSATVMPPRQRFVIFGNADGTGTHEVASVARHMAISEAIERWAFRTVSDSPDRVLYGFDQDPSSSGMAAFPGLFAYQSRQRAMLEAIERYSLIAWWEGRAQGRIRDTEWTGILALEIESPCREGRAVIVFRLCEPGFFAYGHAAASSFHGACERAVLELSRNEFVLRRFWLAGSRRNRPVDLFERRCLFFSTPEGHELFRKRVRDKVAAPAKAPAITFDGEIPGPWTEYATVWRVVLQPVSDAFLANTERYFFW
jgi:ribosomal protein S12 methylthiotransferase accessory factor YcaO